MAGTLDLIREWATDLDYWERAALEKIMSGVALTETDYQNLLSLCMQDAGLMPMSTSPRPALTFPIRLADGDPLGTASNVCSTSGTSMRCRPRRKSGLGRNSRLFMAPTAPARPATPDRSDAPRLPVANARCSPMRARLAPTQCHGPTSRSRNMVLRRRSHGPTGRVARSFPGSTCLDGRRASTLTRPAPMLPFHLQGCHC